MTSWRNFFGRLLHGLIEKSYLEKVTKGIFLISYRYQFIPIVIQQQQCIQWSFCILQKIWPPYLRTVWLVYVQSTPFISMVSSRGLLKYFKTTLINSTIIINGLLRSRLCLDLLCTRSEKHDFLECSILDYSKTTKATITKFTLSCKAISFPMMSKNKLFSYID